MRIVVLALALVLALPLAAAQLPVPVPALPVTPPSPGPDPDEGGQTYALDFDCVPFAQECPARLGAPGESLGAPAIAADPDAPARVLVASLGGARHDALVLQTSADGGASFARATIVPSGVTALALAPAGAGRALLAAATADGVRVWRFPFDQAPAQPEATMPGAAQRVSVAAANGTAYVAWRADDGAHLAWSDAWRSASAPCEAMSNVVIVRDAPLFSCGGDEENTVWRLNATASNLTLLSVAPVPGAPSLAVTPGGRVLLGALRQESPTLIHFRVTTGVNGTGWTLPLDAGTRIHRHNATPAASARVLAMSYQSDSQTLHLVWEEKPVPGNATDRRVVKSLVALSSRGAFYFKHDLGVDMPAARVQGAALVAPADDAQDALFVLGTRELIAWGDDGALVFGELRERSNLPHDSVLLGNGGVSKLSTALTNPPPPKFTVGFAIVAGVLALGVVARVLLGRVSAKASTPKDLKESP